MNLSLRTAFEDIQAKQEALRSAIIDGEKSGDPEPFDMTAIIKEAKKEEGFDA